jgi:hypothetical protein
VLVEMDRLGPDVLDATPGGLPTSPPVAREVDAVARRSGELTDRDTPSAWPAGSNRPTG